MTTNTGGSAFPVPDIDGAAVERGMTLRDYLAAKAMPMINTSNRSSMSSESKVDYIARQAYAIADAMLKARRS